MTNPVKNAYWMLADSDKEWLTKENYPAWTCRECAESRGYSNRCMISTWHEDSCGWCEQIKAVTQPRDYGYPKFSKK
jgi:sulfur relay (sulfurtransferase) complex TusBCD TusD component (DsrE family)